MYTRNKRVFASAGIRSGPVLRVHRLFKDCPEEIAHALIGFYTDPSLREQYREILLQYVSRRAPSSTHRIILRDPPVEFTEALPAVAQARGEAPPETGRGAAIAGRSGAKEIELAIQSVYRVDSDRKQVLSPEHLYVPDSEEIRLHIQVAEVPFRANPEPRGKRGKAKS